MEWSNVVFYGVLIIVIGCILESVLGHIMDLIKPERLERFSKREYEQGVKDATRKVKID